MLFFVAFRSVFFVECKVVGFGQWRREDSDLLGGVGGNSSRAVCL